MPFNIRHGRFEMTHRKVQRDTEYGNGGMEPEERNGEWTTTPGNGSGGAGLSRTGGRRGKGRSGRRAPGGKAAANLFGGPGCGRHTGCAEGCGRFRPDGRGGPGRGRPMDRSDRFPGQAAERPRQEAPLFAKAPAPVSRATAASGFTSAGTCPLCDNHCPLSAPGCPKGAAHARALRAEAAHER